MRSSIQETIVSTLPLVLRPVVRLLLMCGMSWQEFHGIAKSVFVQVASDEYGIRGRPTNISRVAAMTGLSRKEISRIRSDMGIGRWSPDMEASPMNTIIHYWHFDPEFSKEPGQPRLLAFDGVHSFSALVRKYAGDIPPGALKTELCRTGIAREMDSRMLKLEKRFFYPSNFDEDYVNNIMFSMRNLGETVVHNADTVRRLGSAAEIHEQHGRFERYAWSETLSRDSIREFQAWVREEGTRFVERADNWIGEREMRQDSGSSEGPKATGVGVYFFLEE